jgi:crotonobetainyl-CoA:carnitine CoA-transferase CaiB-like acyl-CoA transferase
MLTGIKVLDLSRAVAGPYCTMLLGDFGASVIKLEPPGGDMGRMAGLSRAGEESTYFLAMNRNKRSIVVDLQSEDGKQVLARLVRWADVLVENFRPGVMDRLGFGGERLAELNPRLIVCNISGYGQTGPYRDRKALDLIGQTMSGLASLTGEQDGPPTPAGAPVSDMVTGLNACVGVLTALVARERETEEPSPLGVGVSLVGSTLSILGVEATSYLNTGEVPGRHGSAWFQMFPYDVFPASDGYIAIGVGADWPGLCRILGLDDLAEREDLISMAERLDHRQELKARMSEATRRHTTDHWLRLLQEADILSGPVYALDQVMADPAVRHAGMEIELQHPTAGTVKTVDSSPAFQIGLAGGRPVAKRRRPPPMLGEHTLEILAELGYSDAEVERLCAGSAVSFLP